MTITFLVVLIGVILIILSAFSPIQSKCSGVQLWNLGWGLILFALLVVKGISVP